MRGSPFGRHGPPGQREARPRTAAVIAYALPMADSDTSFAHHRVQLPGGAGPVSLVGWDVQAAASHRGYPS